jgi:hypothetical protein
MSYYKQIEGVRYDRALMEAASEAVSGKGDGRISQADARELLKLVTDGGRVTSVEQATVDYLRENMVWTDKADQWFQAALTQWRGEQDTTTAAPTGPVAVVIRIGKEHPTSQYFSNADAEAAAQAQGCAVVIVQDGQGDLFRALWVSTGPHKVEDLSAHAETALCDGGSAFVLDHVYPVSRLLGTRSGMLRWEVGFTNVPAERLIEALEGLGCRVVEGKDIT